MKKNDFEHFTDLVIGRKPVEELFKTGGKIEKLYILKGGEGSLKQLTAQGREQKIPLFFKEKNFLDRLASGENHQGIIARTGEFSYSSLEDILVFSEKRGEDPFLLILDGIEDPHNLGAIIRSAECTGVHGIIIPKRRAASVNATVIKTSAGASAHMKVAKVTNISETMKKLKERGLWIAACHTEGDTYYSTDLKGPLALVLGNEGGGISSPN